MNAARRSLVALSLAGALSLVPPPALAAWPHDPYIGNVPLCTAAANQYYPTIVSDGAGGAIVTWEDSRSGTNFDIYVQRVSAAGVPLWTLSGVALCTAASDQLVPTIASDGAGGAIVTWYDLRSGTNYDIYAQRVNAAGVPQWTANGVALCTAANGQLNPMIASDGAGGAIVTWQDIRNGANYDIYAQRVNAAGVPQWTANGVALCTAANGQTSPMIVPDGAGGAIVTWPDARGASTDIYTQRVNAAGVPQWTADGVALCTAAGNQLNATIASDGAGGAFVTWQDPRNGTTHIYAQRVNPAGATQWASDGVALCTAATGQFSPTIASDSEGGAIVTWFDLRSSVSYDIYAQRVNSSGAPLWTPDGVALCTFGNDQDAPTIASDGAGGAIVTWYDFRSGYADIYAQRVSAAGVPQWTTNGVAICTAANNQYFPTIASDGAGGAIVSWYDYRGLTPDIYAQRIEHFGYLGNPEPVIASVRDVPNDQGGKVKLSWDASYLDPISDPNLWGYDLLRSVPPNVALSAIRNGARALNDPAAFEATASGSYLVTRDAAATYYWEYLTTLAPLHYVSGYSYLAPTAEDSTGGSNPRTLFMVVGRNYYGSMYWLSPPDSGYSVDNLPPAPPSPFSAAYAGGTTHLHWGANHETDLAGYRLYRGSSSGFVPGPGNLVSAQPDTGFGDPGPAGSWYKLSAVDSHGNESVFAILGPDGTTDAPGGAAAFALSFARPAPDPVLGTSTTLRFGLPRDEPASLVVLDATGRLVRTLVSGTQIAGEHVIEWDLRSDAGRPVPAGLYFLRLSAEGRTLTQRMVALR